eukprot:522134-Rhodomonas_salina.4
MHLPPPPPRPLFAPAKSSALPSPSQPRPALRLFRCRSAQFAGPALPEPPHPARAKVEDGQTAETVHGDERV